MISNTSTCTAKQPKETPACIWMQAGVVERKYCDIRYNCAACRFDKTMLRLAEKNKHAEAEGKKSSKGKKRIVFWQDKLKELPVWKRPCLHHMKGRIDFRSCNQDYRCGKCEFDQYFQDQYSVHALLKAVEVFDIDGFKVPQGYYLHPGHAWVKIEEGEEVCVGMDDFALRLLGPFDGLKLPLLGKVVKQGRPHLAVRRGARRANVLSPVTGVVTAVNMELSEDLSRTRGNPYEHGWMLRIQARNLREDLKNLMIGEETLGFLKNEVDRLYAVIEAEVGPLSVDGGQLGNDIAGNLPETSWPGLVQTFLRCA